MRACYEAGPIGYTLQRQLEAEGVICEVAAPSLIPMRPGSCIKTDSRDARKLAELFRAGLLTEFHPPSEQAEATPRSVPLSTMMPAPICSGRATG